MSLYNRHRDALRGDSADARPVHGRQDGVTLVELIISMVIISIAAVALLQGLGLQSQRNVDPLIQSQAQRLAIQYLQEVSNKSFFDPSADPRLDPSLTSEDDLKLVIAGITDQNGRASSNRLAWDNIFEYNGYDDSIIDIHGDPVAALAGYKVTIVVDVSPGVVLVPLLMENSISTWGSVPEQCPPTIAAITVTVTDPRNQETILSAFRTSYFDVTTILLWDEC